MPHHAFAEARLLKRSQCQWVTKAVGVPVY